MPEVHYVADTGFFVLCRQYYQNIFSSLWGKLDDLVASATLSSVHEVRREIEGYGGSQEDLLAWIGQNSMIFARPNEVEQEKVREMFAVGQFRGLLHRRILEEGRPSADPFVIAKAQVASAGVVVSEEKPASRDKNDNIQGGYKIPDIWAPLKTRQKRVWHGDDHNGAKRDMA